MSRLSCSDQGVRLCRATLHHQALTAHPGDSRRREDIHQETTGRLVKGPAQALKAATHPLLRVATVRLAPVLAATPAKVVTYPLLRAAMDPEDPASVARAGQPAPADTAKVAPAAMAPADPMVLLTI